MEILETIMRTLVRRNRISKEELQAKIDRNLEYLHQIRAPEVPDAVEKVWRFKDNYMKEHPNASYLEAHAACMKAHPEYWPRTLLQEPQSA